MAISEYKLFCKLVHEDEDKADCISPHNSFGIGGWFSPETVGTHCMHCSHGRPFQMFLWQFDAHTGSQIRSLESQKPSLDTSRVDLA